MSYNITGAAESIIAGNLRHWSRLWKITRTDGVIIRLTEAPGAISFDGGTYTPIGGFNATATRAESRMKPTTVEFEGVINADAITADDLYKGLYRGAEIIEYVVDHRYPWAGSLIDNVQWIDDMSYDGESWSASVSGLSRWLAVKLGFLHSRNCMWDLGDVRCKVDLSSLSYTDQTVKQVFVATPRTVITVSLSTGGTVGDNYFQDGRIEWTGPEETPFANQGVVSEIRKSEELEVSGSTTIHRVHLYLPTPKDISVDDEMTIGPGCDKSKTTCIDRFSNIDNFGGFPFAPGTDRLLQAPD